MCNDTATDNQVRSRRLCSRVRATPRDRCRDQGPPQVPRYGLYPRHCHQRYLVRSQREEGKVRSWIRKGIGWTSGLEDDVDSGREFCSSRWISVTTLVCCGSVIVHWSAGGSVCSRCLLSFFMAHGRPMRLYLSGLWSTQDLSCQVELRLEHGISL
jgi:hypothetical protein